MIASLKGEIFSKEPGRVVLDVNGVGYEVFLSLTSYEQLPAVGCEVLLHVYTSVREDAIVLFGFGDAEEKEMFRLLTTVSGVGPRLALNILSGIKPAALVRAIATGDVKRLTGLPGVGKKTAARLCVDLKDKMALAADDDDFFVPETEERSAIGTLFADGPGSAGHGGGTEAAAGGAPGRYAA